MQLNQEANFDESFLFSGNDLYLSETVIVKHPTIEDILNISNSYNNTDIYWKMVSSLICDPYTNMVMLDDKGLNYLEVTPFDVFLIQWAECLDEYNAKKEVYDELGFHPLYYIKQSLSFFLGKEHDFDITVIGEDFLIVDKNLIEDNTCAYYINKEMFNLMSEFIFKINNLSKDDRINPSNESTRKMLIEDMRDEQKRKLRRKNSDLSEKSKDYIGIMAKAICFGGNGGVNVFNYKKLNIYQLFCGMSITDKKDNSNNILFGIYSGNVDAKTINQKDLNWRE